MVRQGFFPCFFVCYVLVLFGERRRGVMLDIIMDTLIDSLKIFPFLLVAFLMIELFEHKFQKKSKKILNRAGKFGPILGGVLGCFPQCGFSVMATNLYVTRIISVGTLISVYLSTSDEMLPIMIAHGISGIEIVNILGIKLFVGIIAGFLIDLFIVKNNKISISELCNEEECHCEKGIFMSSLRHTFHTLFFIMLVSFFLNIIMFNGGREVLISILGNNSLFAPFVTSVIGLIPNCAASVVITELYLNGVLSLSSAMAGLLTGSGVAILVLFKANNNMRENVKILLLLYLIGVFSGLVLELLSYL